MEWNRKSEKINKEKNEKERKELVRLKKSKDSNGYFFYDSMESSKEG